MSDIRARDNGGHDILRLWDTTSEVGDVVEDLVLGIETLAAWAGKPAVAASDVEYIGVGNTVRVSLIDGSRFRFVFEANED